MTAPMMVGLGIAALFVASFIAGWLRARREVKRKRDGTSAERPVVRLDVEIYKRRRPNGRGPGRAA